MNLKWEEITLDQWHGNTRRAKVIGGWLISIVNIVGDSSCAAITFLPDPNHDWQGWDNE